MTTDVAAVISMMRQFASPADALAVERVRDFTTAHLVAVLEELGIESDEITEVAEQWDEFRSDDAWTSLLGSLVELIGRQRGDFDAPLAIWPDLDGAGPSGRFFYFYVFAMCYQGARDHFRDREVPEAVMTRSFAILARHAAIHRRKWGTTGIDAGWWMLVTLRAEMLHVGSLQFHRVNLGVGTLSPYPWYSDDEVATLGAGFRRGDPSLGIHIPEATDLTPIRLDETFDEARRVFGVVWPTSQRRIATCQSWMLDDRLEGWLAPSSRILGFQRRFRLLPVWLDDDEDAIEFIFRRPGVALDDLPRTTSLERAILGVLESGGHWRSRTGWLDFDGPAPTVL